eukprot:1157301-Pelagomonas_calceolata.AAC.7
MPQCSLVLCGAPHLTPFHQQQKGAACTSEQIGPFMRKALSFELCSLASNLSMQTFEHLHTHVISTGRPHLQLEAEALGSKTTNFYTSTRSSSLP